MAYIQKKGQPSWKFAMFAIVAVTLLPIVMWYTTLEKMWDMTHTDQSTLGVQSVSTPHNTPTPTPVEAE